MESRLDTINNAKQYCKKIIDYCDKYDAKYLHYYLYAECLKIYSRLDKCEDYLLDIIFTEKCEEEYNKMIMIDNFITNDKNLNTNNIFPENICTCLHNSNKPMDKIYHRETTDLSAQCIKLCKTDFELFMCVVQYKYECAKYPYVKMQVKFQSINGWKKYPPCYKKTLLIIERFIIKCKCVNYPNQECICECDFSIKVKCNKRKRDDNKN